MAQQRKDLETAVAMTKPVWHAPKIADFGIRVSRRDNPWGGLLSKICGQPTAMFFPGVTITPTRLLKKRADAAQRSKRRRERARATPKYDPLCRFDVYTP